MSDRRERSDAQVEAFQYQIKAENAAREKEWMQASTSAQISIAISLQRIAEALEPIAASLLTPRTVYDPSMFVFDDSDSVKRFFQRRDEIERERASVLDTPMGDELRKAGMIADPPLPHLYEGPTAEAIKRVREAEGHVPENYAPVSPVGEFQKPATHWRVGMDDYSEAGVAKSLQLLANLCDRHKRAALPVPTSSTCARCEQYQNVLKVVEAAAEEATRDTVDLVFSPPKECWCGFPPSAPLHDPKYGSHVFGEPATDDLPPSLACANTKCRHAYRHHSKVTLKSGGIDTRCHVMDCLCDAFVPPAADKSYGGTD